MNVLHERPGYLQFDQLTIQITRKLLNLFQDKLVERNEDADTVIINFIHEYVGPGIA